MKIQGNEIIAEEGKLLRRKRDLFIVGDKYNLGYIYYLNGKKLDIPILLTADDFYEVPDTLPAILDRQEREKRYPKLVEDLIREKYSVSDELALQRQKSTKQDEFGEYFMYCEKCKQKAKDILDLNSENV